MTTLHPDLEALMPKPYIRRATFGGLYTATQMREAILAATERAATSCEQRAVDAPFMEGHLSAMECAAAIRGDAASTGRGEGGEGA